MENHVNTLETMQQPMAINEHEYKSLTLLYIYTNANQWKPMDIIDTHCEHQ